MIGIDISDRSIKVVEIAGEEHARLRTAGWSPMDAALVRRGIIQDVPAVQQTLWEAFKKCSPLPAQQTMAVLSIPETQSFLRVLELPVMTATELDEAVRWAIRPHIPFDVDRMYIDWQLLDTPARTPGQRQVVVGAAQKAVVDPLLQVADGVELQVVALELEAQALVRSLLPRDAYDVVGVLLIDLGATSTNIIFFDRAMRFTTSLQRGGDDLTQTLATQLKLQPSIAAEKKAIIGVQDVARDAQIAVTLRTATLQLVQQISQMVTEITTQIESPQGLRAILLAGGAANLPGIVNIFAEVFPGVPVQLGNPWINLTMGSEPDSALPLSPADASHFTTAIGLALRQPEHS